MTHGQRKYWANQRVSENIMPELIRQSGSCSDAERKFGGSFEPEHH